MKRTVILLLFASLLISACAPASMLTPASSATSIPANALGSRSTANSTAGASAPLRAITLTGTAAAPTTTPKAIPTVTPVPTLTLTSTAAPTATPKAIPTITPVPTIQLGGISVPDPRYSNPELFDVNNPDAPIPQFVNAMKMAGIELRVEQVSQGIAYRTLEGRDVDSLVVASYEFDPDPKKQGEVLEGPIPLLSLPLKNGKEKWDKVTLRELGERMQVRMGTTVDAYPYTRKLLPLYASEFDLALIGYDLDWFNTEPRRGSFVFGDQKEKWANAMQAVAFALENGLQVMGGSLIYPDAYPDWLREGGLSRDELIETVKKHITVTMAQFKGKVTIWPVMNEFHPTRWGRPDILRDVIGDQELIGIAFQTARGTDPSAVLIYNDTNNHILDESVKDGSVTPNTKQIVDSLKPKGLIDGVGLHMHLDGANPPSKQAVIQAMRYYGLPVYSTFR